MAFPGKISEALAEYDRRKSWWRRLFGDHSAIKKLRSLPFEDQTNLFRCQPWKRGTSEAGSPW